MRTTIAAAFIAAAMIGIARQAQAADLIEYYHEAVTHDPVFAAARSALQAGREKYPQGLSELLPQAVATGGLSYQHTTIVQPGYPTFTVDAPARTFNLQLTQPLFRWGNYQQFEQGKLSVLLAEAQFAQAQQDLIVRLAQAYFDVLVAEDSISFLAAQKAAISEQLASAQRNFEVGTATITDTKEAQSRYDLAVAQEIAAQSDLEVRQSALEEIIGKPPGNLARLRTGVKLSGPVPARPEPWVEQAAHQSPLVQQSEISFEISERQIQVARADHYPTLDLVADRQYIREASASLLLPQQGSTATNSVGLQLSIPIYSGGLTSSKVREAVALRDKADADLETARRSAVQNARQAFVGVTSGLAQVNALEAAELSSQSSLESNKLGYQVGVRINIDVLNAQQQLYSTERDLSQARYNTLLNSLKLKTAAGNLQEEDLQTINGLLEH